MGVIVSALNYLLQKVAQVLQWVLDLFTPLFAAAWDFMRDAVVWTFDAFLSLAITALNAFDFSGLLQNVGAWAQLPPSVLEVCAAIGLGTAFGIIGTAILIRLGLQLIPFVRLGS